jgi:hypothetical protein
VPLADREVPAAVQADDGYLYPLERAFFYVHKPPTLLVHDEIESIEFMRQGGGVLAASAKTFDLLIRMRNSTARALLPPVCYYNMRTTTGARGFAEMADVPTARARADP